MVDGNLDEGTVNVLGHVLLIAADVEVRTALKPLPYLSAVFLEPVLNVDFLFLVSGPCCSEPPKVAFVNPSFNFVLVVELGFLGLVTKEQPVLA